MLLGKSIDHLQGGAECEIDVWLYPVCCARWVTAPQPPRRTAAVLPIHISTATLNIAVRLPDLRWSGPGSIP